MTETLPDVALFLESRAQSPEVWREEAEVSPWMLEIAESVGELTGTWNPVEIYTAGPESIKSEKEKFIAAFDQGESYEPVFEYPVAEGMDMSEARSELQDRLGSVRRFEPASEKDRLFRVALYSKIRDDLATCDLVDGIKAGDEALIGRAIRRKYGQLDPVLVSYAEQAYRDLIARTGEEEVDQSQVLLTPEQQKLLKEARIDANELKEAFEWVLNEYGMLRTEANPTGYQVKISDSATSVDVRDKSEEPMTIYIPNEGGNEDSGAYACAVTAHEIEGHARQSMNGMVMFRLGGGRLKMDNEVLYEGLGERAQFSVMSRFFGETSAAPLPWYTLAIKMASEGASFSDIFKDLFDRQMRVKLGVQPEQELLIDPKVHAEQIEKVKNTAWRATYRIMRGHVDMTNPLSFAMTKDLAYLRGWLADGQLGEAGYGVINEMAVIQSGGLQMLARLGVGETDMPYPHQDVVKRYIFEVLLPRLEAAQELSSDKA